MKNIHLLPTDNSSRLGIYNGILTLHRQGWRNGTQHIYITSDEYIGLSYYLDGNLVRKGVVDDKDYWEVRKDYKKIILTTDQDLIKDGVQAIDDNFLEWFVKNPKSENVYVYKEYKQVNQNNPVTRGSTALGFSHYEVQSLDLSAPIETNEKEIVTNLPNSDDFFKQETLEEAVQKVANSDDFINGALFGSLWQQERMYSDEDVKFITLKFFYYWWNTPGNNTEQGFDEWFKEHKKE